ncbi:MAG: FABP family protein [Acidimicrobiia bacterium]|nr:FABP family protein [Acidimicrobiia bacterium]
MSTESPLLHPVLEPYAFMLGTWRGRGEGSYPTIEDFSYVEEITFGHVGKPFLVYSQKTRNADTGEPLHAETGYWRFPSAGLVEVVIAQPTGLLESLAGSVTVDRGDASGRPAATFELSCPDVVTTATAAEVDRTVRRFHFDGDTVSYDMAMAAVGQPLTHHLAATLHKVD